MRRLAAQPPRYLPEPDYLLTIAAADIFIIADTLPFSKHNTYNRTRIRNATGAQWLTVPVLQKGRRGQALHGVRISKQRDWPRQHWKSLLVNYQNAPFFEQIADTLEPLYRQDWSRLVSFTCALLQCLLQVLRIKTSMVYLSDLEHISEQREQRLLDLMARHHASSYLVVEGMPLDSASRQALGQHGYRLETLHLPPLAYHQQYEPFLPGMGVLDLLFNEGVDYFHELLDKTWIST